MKRLLVAIASCAICASSAGAQMFRLTSLPDSLEKKPDTGSFNNAHVVIPFAQYGCEAITLFVLARGDSMRTVLAGSMDGVTYQPLDSLFVSNVTSAQTLIYRATVRAFNVESDSVVVGRGRLHAALTNKPPAYLKLTVRALDEGTNLTKLEGWAWTVR